jgi:AraC-like DNA-binding protein
MAASLLTGSQHTILAISQLVGFESLSSFNRLFKQIMGQSPSQWRQHRQ